MNKNFAEFGKVCLPLTGRFFTNADINFLHTLAMASRKIHFLWCWYKLLQIISPYIHCIVQMQELCSLCTFHVSQWTCKLHFC